MLYLGIGHAQQEFLWMGVYGGNHVDRAYAIERLPDGFIVAGETQSFGAGKKDCYVVRTDTAGHIIWTNTVGGPGNDCGYAVRFLGEAGYVVAGVTMPQADGNTDVLVAGLDTGGQKVWESVIGGAGDDCAYALVTTPDKDMILVGETQSAERGTTGLLIAKVDSRGQPVWQKQYGGSQRATGRAIAASADSGYVITGTVATPDKEQDVYAVKINAAGDSIWWVNIGRDGDQAGHAIGPADDGGFFIAGFTDADDRGRDVLLMKLDRSGSVLWTKSIGGEKNDCAYSLAPLADGGVVLAGYTESYGLGQRDIYLVRTNSSGDVVWYHTYGGRSSDCAYVVLDAGAGRYIIAGDAESYGWGYSNIVLIESKSELGLDKHIRGRTGYLIPFREETMVFFAFAGWFLIFALGRLFL